MGLGEASEGKMWMWPTTPHVVVSVRSGLGLGVWVVPIRMRVTIRCSGTPIPDPSPNPDPKSNPLRDNDCREAGASKPDASAFRLAMEKAGVTDPSKLVES